jgi:uncharacterized linocin/CFP29 family protein
MLKTNMNAADFNPEGPVQFATAQALFGSDRYLRAHHDPARKRKRELEFQRAIKNGHSAAEATLIANHAASPLRWAYQPATDGKWRPRTNAILPENSWRLLTDTVVQVASRQRVLTTDFTSRGLVYNVEDIGWYKVSWQRMDEMGEAGVDLDPMSNIAYDQASFNLDSVPLPVFYKDFAFRPRQLQALSHGPIAVDQAHIAQATRKVVESFENALINGASNIVYDGATFYGLLTHPKRLTQSGSDFGTASQAESTIRLNIAKMRANNQPGPYTIYLASDQFSELNIRLGTTSDKTVRQFILENYEGQISDIKEARWLPTGNMLTLAFNAEMMDLAIAQDIDIIQWEIPGGGVAFRVLQVMAPRLRYDSNDQAPWCVTTGV